jgi:L-alanine-DL-glutamate epimerase-like enolase superfamily enzyme
MDDVPWKWDLIDPPLQIENGEMLVPTGPGLGADVVEDVARAHPIRGHQRAEFLSALEAQG